MTKPRHEILQKVRRAIQHRLSRRSATQPIGRHVRPGSASGSQRALVQRFCKMAALANATVDIVKDHHSVPKAIGQFMLQEGLGDRIVMPPSDTLQRLSWNDVPSLSIKHNWQISPTDRVSLTDVVAGVAETGTLLVRSAADVANAFYFLPEAHIAILKSRNLVGSYEDALDLLRASGDLPRAATFITGPSRTADIEKTPQIGVHGPRQLHIVLFDDAATG